MQIEVTEQEKKMLDKIRKLPERKQATVNGFTEGLAIGSALGDKEIDQPAEDRKTA